MNWQHQTAACNFASTSQINIAKYEQETEIIIPAKKYTYHIVGFTLTIAIALIIGGLGLRDLIVGPLPDNFSDIVVAAAFISIWYLLLIGSISYVGYYFLWMIAGTEVIKINSISVTLEKHILHFKNVSAYQVENISKICWTDCSHYSFFQFRFIYPLHFYSFVSFDNGEKPVKFGQGCGPTEGKKIVGAINAAVNGRNPV